MLCVGVSQIHVEHHSGGTSCHWRSLPQGTTLKLPLSQVLPPSHCIFEAHGQCGCSSWVEVQSVVVVECVFDAGCYNRLGITNV